MKVQNKPSFSIGTVIGIVVLIFLATSSEIYAQGKGTGGIPEVVEQLATISTQLTDIQSRLTALEEANQSQAAQLTVLQDELVPCTPERYLAGLCGANETPFDLAITLCASAGGEAKGEVKYAVATEMSGQVGAGWKEVLDVDATIEAKMPGVIFPFGPTLPIPLVLPSELAVGGGGNVGLGLDGCIEVGKIPIGQFVSRERILTMLNEIASSQSQLVTLLVDTFDPPTAGALDPSALVNSIQAAQNFSDRDFESDDPFAVFSDLDLRAFIETSPLGGRLQRLLDDPGMMFPDMDPFNPNVCERLQNAPTIGAKVEPICSFVNNDLPEFDRLTGTIERVDQINQSLDDLPDLVRFIVEDALPDIDIPSPTPPPAGNTFCQRFPRLCPF